MNNSRGHIFDKQLEKANEYIKEVMNEGNIADPHKAYSVMRATLHTLRDCLTIEEVAHFGSQLPMIWRGVYYESWQPSNTLKKIKNLDDFFIIYM